MRYILIVLLLAGCSGDGPDNEPAIERAYIIAGQSNAAKPNWTHFESLTGYKVINIAVGGEGIDYLINNLNPDLFKGYNIKGIIFIHGEADAYAFTPTHYYVSQVENYRQSISIGAEKDMPLLISSVGSPVGGKDSSHFTPIREAVRLEAEANPKWDIVFDDAEHYAVWGMLADRIHANEIGQTLMMDAFAAYANK